MRLTILFCLSFFVATSVFAQEQQRLHFQLSPVGFASVAARCAPSAPTDTLLAIARTESGLNPNAISINRPKAAARLAGHPDGELVLEKQPKNLKEAKAWLEWLSVHRYTVSVGLMQVNVETARQFDLKPEQLLDSCTNLRVATAILRRLYTESARKMGEGFSALDVALSLYNTGDPSAGFQNGYVANVYAKANRTTRPLAH
jgi:type IV secretion system protein VirB1